MRKCANGPDVKGIPCYSSMWQGDFLILNYKVPQFLNSYY